MKQLFIFLLFFTAINGCSKEENLVVTNPIYDYSIDQMVSCFCPEIADARIFVVADTIISVISLSDGLSIPYQYWKRYRTIKNLFEFIATCDTVLFNIQVEYDSLYGYPSFVAMYPKTSSGLRDIYMAFRTRNYIKY